MIHKKIIRGLKKIRNKVFGRTILGRHKSRIRTPALSAIDKLSKTGWNRQGNLSSSFAMQSGLLRSQGLGSRAQVRGNRGMLSSAKQAGVSFKRESDRSGVGMAGPHGRLAGGFGGFDRNAIGGFGGFGGFRGSMVGGLMGSLMRKRAGAGTNLADNAMPGTRPHGPVMGGLFGSQQSGGPGIGGMVMQRVMTSDKYRNASGGFGGRFGFGGRHGSGSMIDGSGKRTYISGPGSGRGRRTGKLATTEDSTRKENLSQRKRRGRLGTGPSKKRKYN